MEYSNLIVEVTRNCQFQCQHCLRGDRENLNISTDIIDTLLEDTEYISMLTFSGGEPSLATNLISYFLDICIENNIEVGSFYIATNGANISVDFIVTMLRWYSYCIEKEMCFIEVSNDIYHSEEGNYDTVLLEALSFFNRKHTEENYNYDNGKYLLDEGYTNENGIGSGRAVTVSPVTTKDDFYEADIYLNAEGNIINGCDWSYENQNEHILCNVKDVKQFYENLIGD